MVISCHIILYYEYIITYCTVHAGMQEGAACGVTPGPRAENLVESRRAGLIGSHFHKAESSPKFKQNRICEILRLGTSGCADSCPQSPPKECSGAGWPHLSLSERHTIHMYVYIYIYTYNTYVCIYIYIYML